MATPGCHPQRDPVLSLRRCPGILLARSFCPFATSPHRNCRPSMSISPARICSPPRTIPRKNRCSRRCSVRNRVSFRFATTRCRHLPSPSSEFLFPLFCHVPKNHGSGLRYYSGTTLLLHEDLLSIRLKTRLDLNISCVPVLLCRR